MGNAVRRIAAKIRAAFWKAMLTDQLRPLVWVYYIALFAWGIYGTFFAGPATYVLPVMGQPIYDVWVWLHIVGTTIVMCGMLMEDPSKAGTDDPLWKTSVRLQTGGHGCMFSVLLSYEMSAIAGTHFGEGVYSIFVIGPYVIGCVYLTVQGIAKIVDAERAR